jgi:phosphatidylserine/phosphatidylglycerophosphate/cardiolipin synthase-like enzyme
MIDGDEDTLSRLSAALWARVGRELSPTELGWARNLWHEAQAPDVLRRALEEAGSVSGNPPVLWASPLAALLADLAGVRPSESELEGPRLVWTLPAGHPLKGRLGGGYLNITASLLEEACKRVVLVSPYIEVRGVGLLFDRLAGALSRGVATMLITYDLSDIASTNSRAVEELRKEAERVSGRLQVFSATSATGRDREHYPLLHAKLLIVDRRRLLLGSANLTSYGLSSNFEAGTLLGQRDAQEADETVQSLIEAGMVQSVFRTGAGCDW